MNPAVIRPLVGTALCVLFAILGVEAGGVEPGAGPGGSRGDAARELASAARQLLAELEPEERQAARFGFADDERFDWHFVPRSRKGLAVGELDEPERAALDELLAALLDARGVRRVHGVIALETVLFELESRPDRPATWRDSERYFLSFFGEPPAGEQEPASAAPWGWRFEGHHLCLNVTVAGGEVAVTPLFFGANPAHARGTAPAHASVLGTEEQLGRELARSLSEAQREQAFSREPVPADVILGPGRDKLFDELEGIALEQLDPEQRALAERLLAEFLGSLRAPLAERERERIEAAGLERVHFLWAGSLEPFEAHYYRLSGPTFAVEYDNVQNGANHVHLVWRDATRDFGRDLLREHHAAEHR